MHVHTQHAVPWLLVAVLGACAAVSAARFARGRSDDDLAHLLMNATMAAMAMDASMSLGPWWITITLALAGFLGALYTRRQTTAQAVHVVAALMMVFATVAMLTGTTGGPVAYALATIVLVDVTVSVFLAATGRTALTPNGTTIVVDAARIATIPHIGMGIGMLAMLVGA